MATVIFECDHMRPVVRRGDRYEGRWHHIGPNGYAADECQAGVYKVKATTEAHIIGRNVGWIEKHS